jgi:hypothetical protein
MANLPVHLVAVDWAWTQLKEYWVAIDHEERKWLVKMTGSSCAYREHVFAALAQRLDISCQSSVYLTIPRNAPPMLNGTERESHQLAIWFLNEHQASSCSQEQCPLTVLKNLELNSEANLQTLLYSGVSRAIDLIHGEILGYLCGQLEPSGCLFTGDHRFVQIDNELMFDSDPISLEESPSRWLRFPSGRKCVKTVCGRLSELSDEELIGLAQIPEGYVVRCKNDIPRRLLAAKKATKSYLTQLQSEI